MNKDTTRQIVNVIAVIATLVINALSQILPFNDQTSAQIANRYENYFLPANYVFSIWSIIYVGLIAFGIYQALPAQRENPRFRRIGYWFAGGCVANCVWLFLFHYNQFALSTVAMAILLFSLVMTYLRLREGDAPVSLAEQWAARVTFSIYTGWITVAMVANVTYVLEAAEWDGFGIARETWGVIILIVAGVIAGTFAYRNRDIAYAGVIVWSFVGIIYRFPSITQIVVIASAMAAAVGIAALIAFFVERQEQMMRGSTRQRASRSSA